ncbi:Protein da1 [Turnera subulata]|uniref:Protein da1 n=1 Tax=Turnera subulata TaxID=218843 RepID=A0A9Q0FZ88_9ROSI|nr:Protein da1 [Turnera subulata]
MCVFEGALASNIVLSALSYGKSVCTLGFMRVVYVFSNNSSFFAVILTFYCWVCNLSLLKKGHYHMPETRGLCLSEEQIVSTILRHPSFGAGNRAMGMVTEPYRLTRHCEVTAILILYGLPRLLTGSILAHEMMHAWMRLKGFQTLSQDVEEGICQVLAHMWLTSELASASGSDIASSSASRSSKGTRSPFERKLGEFFKHQIESDTSPVYGDGFRAGLLAVQKYGLQRTLDHIRMTGRFPY